MPSHENQYWIAKQELTNLIRQLQAMQYVVLGPQVDGDAIVLGPVEDIQDLPRGVVNTQQPGKYRLGHNAGGNYFEFNVGPQSWKQFLFPPTATIANAKLSDKGWEFSLPNDPQPKFACLGVRACELAALAIQDRVFLGGEYVDPLYKQRRQSLFLIAVNCSVAAETCFCTSMNSGPKCTSGFDLALTELDEGFVIEIGSQAGSNVLQQLESRTATAKQGQQALRMQQRAAEQITKHMQSAGIRDLLMNNLEHPHWDEVASRCLSCANCTMVCPTCFCSSVKDVADLSGEQVARQREWDSCFNLAFSYTAGGTVRNDRRSRFRQWLTHKLATWHDQFDSSGCVGCGRCITWCPVGIDLTEEVEALRQAPLSNRKLPIAEPSKTVCVVSREAKP